MFVVVIVFVVVVATLLVVIAFIFSLLGFILNFRCVLASLYDTKNLK